ncbi:HET-domain-containing protein [Xylariomycetidae sp. FL2044]|nr:HET-domain-containing protein [Xylariomycetidae sp. FL2044]
MESATLFTPIDNSKRQIRLLDISPGQGSEPLRCTHRVVSLDDDNINYNALSYVWGPKTAGKSVFLGETCVEVTDNLFDALHALRSKSEPVTLWVDALCINQNSPEKTEQVHMMRLIYERCSNCFIQFGRIGATDPNESEEDSLAAAKAALDAVRVVADPDSYSVLPPSLSNPELQARAGKSFQQIQYSPWWLRIWTIQESIAPPRYTLLWGPLTMDWGIFVRFYENSRKLWWPNHLGLNFFVFFPSGSASELSASFTALDQARDWHTNPPNPLDMLVRFQYRKSTDPLDKVYTVLGLLGEGMNPLPSVTSFDYELPPATLFKRVSLDLFRDEWGLRPLIGQRGTPKPTPRIPSWAIDWTSVEGGINNFWAHNKFYLLFTADRGLPMLDRDELTADEDDNVIRLNGLFFDKVLVATDSVRPGTDEVQILQLWDKLVAEETRIRDSGLGPAAKTFRDIAFRFMMWGAFLDNSDHAKEWRDTMWSNQTVFITETGFIGLGPSTVERGDEVWIMSGGRVPLLFRALSMGSRQDFRDEGDDYTFVGDAYMPGNMHGEAVESRSDRQRFIRVH